MNSSHSYRVGVTVLQKGVSRNREAAAALEALFQFQNSPNTINTVLTSDFGRLAASSQIFSSFNTFRSTNHMTLTMGEMEWGQYISGKPSFMHPSGSHRHFHFFRFLSSLNVGPEKQKKVVPDAEQCDSALEDFQQLKNRLDNLKKPSALKPWNPIDLLKLTGSILLATGRFAIAIPGWTRDFMNMPKDEWAKKKSEMWKTVKHEVRLIQSFYW